MTSNKVFSKFKFLNILFLVVCVYFIFTFASQQMTISKYDSKIKMYSNDIQSKQSLINYYTSEKQNVNSVEYIEKIARENLGLVKSYEKIFVDVNK